MSACWQHLQPEVLGFHLSSLVERDDGVWFVIIYVSKWTLHTHTSGLAYSYHFRWHFINVLHHNILYKAELCRSRVMLKVNICLLPVCSALLCTVADVLSSTWPAVHFEA